jgi:hypothetical protein
MQSQHAAPACNPRMQSQHDIRRKVCSIVYMHLQLTLFIHRSHRLLLVLEKRSRVYFPHIISVCNLEPAAVRDERMNRLRIPQLEPAHLQEPGCLMKPHATVQGLESMLKEQAVHLDEAEKWEKLRSWRTPC